MSNRPHRRPRLPRPDRSMVEAALLGCTCTPWISHHDGQVTVSHDDDCPLVNKGTQLVIRLPHKGTP